VEKNNCVDDQSSGSQRLRMVLVTPRLVKTTEKIQLD
jgi:hypothetical protein